MTDNHPMSDGQKHKAWRVVHQHGHNPVLAPCRAEDLQVGEVHVVEGIDELLIVTTAPVFIDGAWTGMAMGFMELWNTTGMTIAGATTGE